MKQIQRQLFAVFVIVLLTTQEFCSAKHHPRKLQISDEELYSLVKEKATREKRSIGAVLFGVALFVSLANIGFDIYLQIEGCCGLYPETCTYQKQFNETRKSITKISKNIDTKWLLSQNLLTYVSQGANKNEEIALELKRITQKYESIIQTVDPEIINGYNNITNDIKKAVESKNSTVLTWSNVDVEFEFKSLFSTSIGRLQVLSGLISHVATATLGYAWNWYKTAKIGQMLKTNYGHQLTNVNNQKALKTLGGLDADKFIKQTAVSRRSASVSTSRGAQAIKVASGVLSLVQIGVEIWMAVMKIQQCQSIRDKIKEALDRIKPEEVDMGNLYLEIQEHYSNMTGTWNFIKGEVDNDDFLSYLQQIKDLADSASTKSASIKTASSDIQSFMNTIKSTTDKKVFSNKQTQLIGALEKVTFTLDCYHKKVKTFQITSDRCELGMDTLTNLYTQVSGEFDTNAHACKTASGIDYTSYSSVVNYVKTQATTKGFQADCVLNDQTRQSLICAMVCSKESDSKIKSTANVDDGYLAKFKALCPTSCPLTPNDKAIICRMKSFGIDFVYRIYAEPDYGKADVKAAFDAC